MEAIIKSQDLEMLKKNSCCLFSDNGDMCFATVFIFSANFSFTQVYTLVLYNCPCTVLCQILLPCICHVDAFHFISHHYQEYLLFI